MKVLAFSLGLIFLFQGTSLLASSGSDFYSVASVIGSIQESDLDNHRPLKIKAPETLYHWLSVNSAYRLFQDYNPAQPFPMKEFGNGVAQSIISSKVTHLNVMKGLFAWHNPVGATVGGSGEIYGNNEAVLGLKLSSKIRVGLIVTSEDHYSNSEKLEDPRIVKNYDLILHVTGLMLSQSFAPGYIEWVILNPNIITDFTLDAQLISEEMNRYKTALKAFKTKDKVPLIEKVAGPQHSGLGSYSINPNNIDQLMKRIVHYSKDLGRLPYAQDWHTRAKSCKVAVGQ